MRHDEHYVDALAASAGAPVGRIVSIAADPLVASGSLVPVLADQTPDEALPVYAVMLQERHRLPKIRACIDHWAGWLTPP